MKFTSEQEEIFTTIDNMKKNETISIKAAAGTGKTTTLIEIASRHPDKRILYLAFNKAIKEESAKKFPQNVYVKTIHGFAYSFLNTRKYFQNRELKSYRTLDIKEILGVNNSDAYIIFQALETFLNSAYSFEEYGLKLADKRLSDYVKEILVKMEKNIIPITHDYYLKYFEKLLRNNEKFKIYEKYDLVLLDEAQDTNDLTLAIFNQFQAIKAFVGDSSQAIYSWRGSVDAFKKIKADYSHSLSNTFRCNDKICKRANEFLATFKKSSDYVKLNSMQTNKEKIITKGIISRTNASIITYLNEAKNLNKIKLIRSPHDIFDLSINLVYILKGNFKKVNYAKFGFLKNFENLKDIEKIASETHDIELENSVKVANSFKDTIFDIFKKAKIAYEDNDDKNIFITTAHTAKGLEFDSVFLMNDFPNLWDYRSEVKMGNMDYLSYQEEVNLYYVAITRAKFELKEDAIALTYNNKTSKKEEKSKYPCTCKEGYLILKEGRFGKFWGCSNYPQCKITVQDDKGKPKLEDMSIESFDCPKCGSKLIRRKYKKSNDFYWFCSNFKNCDIGFLKDYDGEPLF